MAIISGPIGHCLPTTTTPEPIPEQLPTTTTTTPLTATTSTTTRTTAIPIPASPNTLTTTKIPQITTSTTTTKSTTAISKILQQQQQQLQQQQTQRSASLNACPQENCLNGGTCLGYSSNYTCICASGYTGLAYPTQFPQRKGCPKSLHAKPLQFQFSLNAVSGPKLMACIGS